MLRQLLLYPLVLCLQQNPVHGHEPHHPVTPTSSLQNHRQYPVVGFFLLEILTVLPPGPDGPGVPLSPGIP